MPEFTVALGEDIEISASEFIDECTVWDIDDLIEELTDRGYLDGKSSTNSVLDHMFNQVIDKISRNRLQLTNEEEAMLHKLASRLV
jgi:hypothetical protein